MCVTRYLEMPHDKFREMTGNCHVQKVKGTMFEHDPHGYHVESPLHSSHAGIDAAVAKEKRLAGLKE
jgi:hypothetical protein